MNGPHPHLRSLDPSTFLFWDLVRANAFRLVVIGLATIALLLAALPLEAQVRVRGYYRSDGTYVRPHVRTRPDGNPYNNYSFPGNYNPNTGRITGGDPSTYLRNYYDRAPVVRRYVPLAEPPASPAEPSKVTVHSLPGERQHTVAIQEGLAALGFDPGPKDGLFGPRTAAALMAFQRSAYLHPDGRLTPATIDSLVARLRPLPEEADPSSSFLSEAELVGTWAGAYTCNQGRTGLLLQFESGSSGTFLFYPLSDNPSVAVGLYRVRVILGEGRSLRLEPQIWINRPPGYEMVGLTGSVGPSRTVMSGRVAYGGCTGFTVHKQP